MSGTCWRTGYCHYAEVQHTCRNVLSAEAQCSLVYDLGHCQASLLKAIEAKTGPGAESSCFLLLLNALDTQKSSHGDG